ncbi:MAG: hypothetical protein QXG86_02475 [Candidatus Woesearchaeota archaeon]
MKEIIEFLSSDTNFNEDYILLNGNKEKIDTTNFRIIEDTKNDLGVNFLFLDGGNAEIAKTPAFSIQFIRVVGVYLCNDKNSSGRKQKTLFASEFYSIIKLSYESSGKKYKIKNLPIKGKEILPKEFIVDGLESPSAVGDFIRRLSEISMSSHILEEMEEDDILIIDGTLEASSKMEAEMLLDLHYSTIKKGVMLCSVAKTTTMTTAKGNSVIACLNKLAPTDKWFYPIKKDVPTIFFAKLHPKSNYIFKIETNKSEEKLNENLFINLAKISKDPIFLGYPFGMVEVDRIARVSKREAEILRIELSAKVGDFWKFIEKEEKSLDAHNVLDSIS